MLYAKFLTWGGLSPLGGFGGPFFPQAPIMIAAVRKIITVRTTPDAGFKFTVVLSFTLPAPNSYPLQADNRLLKI